MASGELWSRPCVSTFTEEFGVTEFFEGVSNQFRVISALMIRDITARHGPEAVGMAWLLAEPMLITIIVLLLHWYSSGGSSLVPFEAVLLTGYMPHLMLRHGGLAGLAALRSGRGLLFHQRIHFLDLVVARMLTEVVSVLVAFAILFAVFFCFGLLTLPKIPGLVYLGWFFHIWFLFVIGFIFTGLSLRWELVRRLFQPFNLIMIVPYGAFFLFAWLPYDLRQILLYFPCANATEIMRMGYFGTSVPTYFSISYTLFSLVILSAIAIVTLYRGRKHLEF